MSGRKPLLAPPEFGAPVSPIHPSSETLDLLATRRSTPVAMLGEPGPPADDLRDMLRLALRVPDHRKLEPWRVLVIEGAAREALGEAFAAALKASRPDASALELDEARGLPMRAPVIATVISSPVDDPKKTPVWEQELSAGAVCQTLMIAAQAMGWAACWISEWPAYDAGVAKALGLSERERVAGFIYLGTAKAEPVERARPDIAKKVQSWQG
ncbi:MAG: nitroreductase [Alphaproteobacteria bacterium]|nr:nitroreductase [Alphaproteobacteria bacterium]